MDDATTERPWHRGTEMQLIRASKHMDDEEEFNEWCETLDDIRALEER